MPQSTIRAHLRRTAALVQQSEQSIARQRAIIEEMAGYGLDISFARAVLHQFEEIQADIVAAQDQLITVSGSRPQRDRII